jgi:hypothetical protein
MRNVQNWLIEGSRLNCSGCRTQVKGGKGGSKYTFEEQEKGMSEREN